LDGWAAVGFTYDDLMNTPGTREYFNLSGRTLVFGIKGDEPKIKFEVSDSSGNKSSVYLDGISAATMKYFSIDLSKLTGNADMSKASSMYFIVEGHNKSGSIDIKRWPQPVFLYPSTTLSETDISVPGNPSSMPLAPFGDQVTVTQSARGFRFTYNTETQGVDHTTQYPDIEKDGWAGAGLVYDNLGTASTKEYYDLSSTTQIILGIKNVSGDCQRVKLEVVDASGNKSALYLDGLVLNQEKVFSIDLSKMVGNANMARVSYIFFVVEGHNRTGTVEINRLPVSGTNWIEPSSSLTTSDINIPLQTGGYPRAVGVASLEAQALVQSTARGLMLSYNTHAAGWAGAGFDYDNSATGGIEVADLRGYTNLIVGLKGGCQKVKFEVKDSLGNSAFVYLNKVRATQENEWAVTT
jgi:hypothetical protein